MGGEDVGGFETFFCYKTIINILNFIPSHFQSLVSPPD